MTQQWFKKTGWIYIPSSMVGVIISLFALTFCVNVFWAINRHEHSVSDVLYGVFPYFVCTMFLYNWIASNTSKRNEQTLS